MASSSISRVSSHARSISLPSRSHPLSEQFEEHLCRLRSSQSASTSSSSVSHRLSCLKDLFQCVDELLQLPLNQQALSQNVNAKWGEDVLDGSLRLLDICAISRDVLLQSKEHLQDIQSVLRRKYSGELSIAKEVVEYQNIRMRAKRAIKKCLKDLKEANKNDETNAVVGMLKDVEAITIDIFKSLLSYIAGEKLQSRKSSWSQVSKLFQQSADKESETFTSEFAAVDLTLNLLICKKKKSSVSMLQVENIQRQIIKLESEIQDFDEALECLSRHLEIEMATSTKTKAPQHSRSVRLPSKSHPIAAQLDEELSRMKSCGAASTSYSQILSQNWQAKWVDLALDGSLRFLDLCGTARDALSQSKERSQEIQYVLCRRMSVFHKQKTGFNTMQMENLRSDVVELESEIQNLDEALELLYRHLDKTRATILHVPIEGITRTAMNHCYAEGAERAAVH
ncbi:hypothetical protein Cgig2_019403 [Carnegiea gigantea]|uniref:Uncharacterized protein n=1 Tax=Carnegiea gigantea TaxID=171969 RepID=A0A9Q1KPP1_9CARY|nr:hypothetical protein Cgig2_019403 [Carnegiea gigantea]